MSKSFYITGLEAQSGKTLAALAFMQELTRRSERVSVFRTIVLENPESDRLIRLMMDLYGLRFSPGQMYGVTGADARALLAGGEYDELYSRILERYKSLEKVSGYIVCVGTDYMSASRALEFNFNVEVARNLGSSLVPVINGQGKDQVALFNAVRALTESLEEKKCDVLALVVNRVGQNQREELISSIKKVLPGSRPVFVFPEDPLLGRPTVGEVSSALGAKLIGGNVDWLDGEVSNVKIGAMELPNFLDHLEDGSLVITPGDRSDIIIGSLAADRAINYPHVAGVVLTGNLQPAPQLLKLMEGLRSSPVPVLYTQMDTFTAAMSVTSVRPSFAAENRRRTAAALGIVGSYMDLTGLLESAAVQRTDRVTPLMFQYELIRMAKLQRKHIVLPEGTEERVLRAVEIVLLQDICDITLLGNQEEVRHQATAAGLSLKGVRILDPHTSELLPAFAEAYYEVRKHKGISPDMARDTLLDVSYFGTMMVHQGLADGMVSGIAHTTAHTIRPSLEFVKRTPGISTVSSSMFLCLADRVLVYGDCVVVPEPTASQLADIAISSAATARAFGIEPRVAMLSYSTGQSGSGPDVDRVREGTRLARERCPDLKIEGPIQYDAAVDPTVAKVKLPGSEVAGHATVFIFPDLNAGNNACKAVQQSANAVIIGPVLQGLTKPVNDMSRGAVVPEIVNTIAITAIQAQAAGGKP